MKITKYEHACMVIEEQGKKLVIDPGIYTRELVGLTDVAAVVFTHVHADHFSAAQSTAILKSSPDAQVIGTDEVATEAEKTNIKIRVANTGNTLEVGPFHLEFFGGRHELIAKGKPDNDNVGVLVNDKFYYPGDSFDTPGDIQPEILALPVSGPWLKIGESITLLEAVRPTKLCIPTHDALLSDIGLSISERWLPDICTELGAELKVLRPGESVEVL